MQAILDKIIGDAQASAENIIAEANAKAQKIVAEAEDSCQKSVEDAKSYAQKEYADAMEKAKVISNLDSNKKLGIVKKQILGNLFDSILKNFAKQDTKKYVEFIKKLLKESAEDGDVVVISENDKDVITEQVIAQVSKNLKLSATFGNFVGGFVLQSKYYDKNLTLEILLRDYFSQNEKEIYEQLF